jgi:hypothetical protein
LSIGTSAKRKEVASRRVADRPDRYEPPLKNADVNRRNKTPTIGALKPASEEIR